MYGWRAKIGVLVPCVNTTTEPEFNILASKIPGVSIHSARMHLDMNAYLTKEALLDMHSLAVEETVPELMHANVDLIVFACTSGSFAGGIEWDAITIKKIRQETGIRTITTSSAILEAMKFFEVENVAMGTPYDEKITNLGISFFEEAGFNIVKYISLDCMESIVREIKPTLAYDLGRDVDSPKADCVFISCTQFPTIKIVSALERDIGKPVITANLASFWQALKLLSINFSQPEFGRLFA